MDFGHRDKLLSQNPTHAGRLSLRPLVKSDGDRVIRWMSSAYIVQHSFVISSAKCVPKDFASIDYAYRYFELLLNEHKRVSLAIVVDRLHIGNIGLKTICPEQGSAECFIEIGDPDFRGRGFGREAMVQLLDIAFYRFGLVDIDLDVLEFNFRALKLYTGLGFITVGVSAWHCDEFGQYWKVFRMGHSKWRWEQRVGRC